MALEDLGKTIRVNVSWRPPTNDDVIDLYSVCRYSFTAGDLIDIEINIAVYL